MASVTELLRKILGGADAAPPAVQRPSYFVGERWTPSRQQIDEARARQKRRRTENVWHRLAAAELEPARAAMLCATDRGYVANPEVAQRLRAARELIFHAGAEIFVRNLRVSPDRTLIELRHPTLLGSDGRTPVGLRFIGLSRAAWKNADVIGVFLDGTPQRIKELFAPNFDATLKDPDLAESYVRFTLDHELFGDDQLYLISDTEDFVVDENKDPSTLANAQFRMISPPEGTDKLEQAVAKALKISSDDLIPPTFIPGPDASARVFTTIIMRQKLYHVCFEVRANGDVLGLADSLRQRTAEEETLPLVPVRSFAEEFKALKGDKKESGPGETS